MDFLEWLGEKFSEIYEMVLGLLPQSPIVYLTTNETISKYMSYLNWFFPIYLWISILEGWLAAIAVYYIVQVILRWAKVVE